MRGKGRGREFAPPPNLYHRMTPLIPSSTSAPVATFLNLRLCHCDRWLIVFKLSVNKHTCDVTQHTLLPGDMTSAAINSTGRHLADVQ